MPNEELTVVLNAKDRASRKLKQFDRNLRTMTGSARRFAKVGLGVAAAGLTAVGGALGTVINRSADFDQALQKSLAISSNVNQGLREEAEKTALSVSGELNIAANQTAESFFYLQSAGLDLKQSIASLPVAADFAKAGMFDLATATELSTDAQSALGLQAEDTQENMENLRRVTDTLVKANTLANASVNQFSEALTNKAGPRLRQLNKSVEEGVAALAAFADQGRKGRRAGEQLNIILRDLPARAEENSEAFKRLGVDVFDAQGNLKSISDIVKEFDDALAGLSDEQRKATLRQLNLNKRAADGLVLLSGTSDRIQEYRKELEQAGGTAEQVANRQLNTFNEQLGRVFKNLNRLIVRGEGGLLNTLTSDLKGFADQLQNMSEGEITQFRRDAANMIQTVTDVSLALAGLSGAVLTVTSPFLAFSAAAGVVFVTVHDLTQAVENLWSSFERQDAKDTLNESLKEISGAFERSSQSIKQSILSSFDIPPREAQELANRFTEAQRTINEVQKRGAEEVSQKRIKEARRTMEEIEERFGGMEGMAPGGFPIPASKMQADVNLLAGELRRVEDSTQRISQAGEEIRQNGYITQDLLNMIEKVKQGKAEFDELIESIKRIREGKEQTQEVNRELENTVNLAGAVENSFQSFSDAEVFAKTVRGTDNLNQEMRDTVALFEAGLISRDQFMQSVQGTGEESGRAFKQAFEDPIENTLLESARGEFEDFGDFASSFAQNLSRSMSRTISKNLSEGIIEGVQNQTEGSGIASLISTGLNFIGFGGGGGGSTSGGSPQTLPGTQNLGDSPGVMKSKGGSLVRFREGDKVAAAQSLQGLKNQVQGAGGTTVQRTKVVNNINAIDAKSFQERLAQNGDVIGGQAAQNVENDGALRQSVRNNL